MSTVINFARLHTKPKRAKTEPSAIFHECTTWFFFLFCKTKMKIKESTPHLLRGAKRDNRRNLIAGQVFKFVLVAEIHFEWWGPLHLLRWIWLIVCQMAPAPGCSMRCTLILLQHFVFIITTIKYENQQPQSVLICNIHSEFQIKWKKTLFFSYNLILIQTYRM